MAGADAFPARGRARSIPGLARVVAKPRYQRMLNAEPLVQRTVPLMVIVFLLSLGAAILHRVQSDRVGVIAAAEDEIRLLTAALAADYGRIARMPEAGLPIEKALTDYVAALPTSGRRETKVVVVTDETDVVIATTDRLVFSRDRRLIASIGSATALMPMQDGFTSGRISLRGDREVLFAARDLPAPLGLVLVTHDIDEVLESWRSSTQTTLSLFVVTAFVVLLLGFAFHWQSIRAREADGIYEKARARMETALSRGRCGLWDWDIDRDRVYWSASMLDILGQARQDGVRGFGDVVELLHPDDANVFRIARARIAAGGRTIDHDFRIRHADGNWIWMRTRAELVTADDGTRHLVGVALDITEQQLLAERRASEDVRLRDAIEAISESFVVWDAENRLVMCNTKFQEQHALPADMVRPGTPFETIAASGRQVAEQRRIRRPGGDTGGCTFEVRLEDGRWLNINERRTKDGGFVSVGTDITPIKRHEEKLVASDGRLRKTVQMLEQQTQALQEMAEKYAEEKTRALEANRIKSDFLANMSHELRTPLNAIIGFSEIMQSGMFGPLGSEKYAEYVADIRESGAHLLDVINDILDMSKLEAGRFRLTEEVVELDAIIEDALRLTDGRAAERRLTVTEVGVRGVRLQADKRALKQILLNLLSNATKFTPELGSIRVVSEVLEGDLLLTIEDTGIGIPDDMIAQLGQPFVQVENQYTKTQKGSGLGLAISRSLAELHGGSLSIRSREGSGTAITIRLPRVVSAHATKEPERAAA
jgi:two-component system, cell cycle sensor histidine kinase PleC